MMNQYLQKVPTLIVIGVTGYAAWPTLFPEGDSGPPKGADKPPATASASASDVAALGRNPFQMDRPAAVVAATPAKAAGSPSPPSAVAKPAGLPDLPADEDKVLSGMRLGGTFIDGREQLAVIDNKVYARGEQLRGADGSPLPYVIERVGKDRAVLRRGRSDFILAFSNVPRVDVPGAPAPARSSAPPAIASPAKVETAARGKDGLRSRRPGGDPGDPGAMLLQFFSGFGGPSGAGGSPAPGALAGLGAASGLNPGSLGAGVNPDTISAGLNALMGKFDNIGRGGDDSALLAPGGGTTP